MDYFNGHIALNWIFTICSAPNFECKRTYFTITSVSNDISNLNACICSHNAADSWDIFFFQAQIKGRNLLTLQIALPPSLLVPHLVKLFYCRHSFSNKPILLYLGVKSLLSKLMCELIFTMLPLSSPKSPLAWMTVWQMQGIKSISFNRCSGGDKSGCVGQSGSASIFAFMSSFYTGFGKSTLLQVNLGLPGTQAAWPQSGTHYSRKGAQIYQNIITTSMWKAAMRQ